MKHFVLRSSLRRRHFILIILLVCPFLSISQDLFDYKHSFDYGKYLYSVENYNGALSEFERCRFLNPADDTLPVWYLKASRKAGEYERGFRFAEEYFKKNPSRTGQTKLEYCDLLLLARANRKIDSLFTIQFFSGEHRHRILLVKNILEFKWNDAFEELKKTDSSGAYGYDLLAGLVGKEMNFKKKKAGLAFIYSVIPGMGKVYAGSYKDGMFTFFLVGTTAFLAYRGFYSHKSWDLKSVPGWLYGSLGAAFYLGNFYGGVKRAKQHNENFIHDVNEEVDFILRSRD